MDAEAECSCIDMFYWVAQTDGQIYLLEFGPKHIQF